MIDWNVGRDVMKIRKITETEYTSFLDGMNRAFRTRSNAHIPYSEMSQKELLEEIRNGLVLYGAFNDDCTIIGGSAAKVISSAQVCTIKHVWVDPVYQGKGIARLILNQVEQTVGEMGGMRLLKLSVASNYEPAIRLYRKMGYKSGCVYANIPGTYYFIEMVKPIKPYHLSEIKRMSTLFLSKLKFRVLFFDDSTPNLIHRLVYEREKLRKESDGNDIPIE